MFSAAPQRIIDPAKTYTAAVRTSKGDLTITLAAAEAPLTVNNFVFLSCTGYFDGLTFHRVVDNFVVQGGDPRGDGTGGPGYRFADEFSPGLRHNAAGILSMANSGPATNGSQFFITLGPQPHLDDRHSVFGRVATGMETVRNIRQGDRIVGISIEEK
jgi:peptidyl-prolyl cis-trans isomerase B (cyclophilin B)